MYFSRFKNRDGITLVALVITIIVLLILAGVTIAMVVGDNGIISRANEAQNNEKMEEAREDVLMVLATRKADYIVDNYELTLEELSITDINELTNVYAEKTFEDDLKTMAGSGYRNSTFINGIEQDDDGNDCLKITYKGYEFYINEELEVLNKDSLGGNSLDDDDDTEDDNTPTWADGLTETNSDYFSYDAATGTKITGFSSEGLGKYNDGELSTIVLPTTHNDITIVEIGGKAFENKTGIETLVIPDSVTTIAGGAFYGCTGIEKVKMPITANIAKSTSIFGVGFYNTTSVKDVILTSGSNGEGCDYSRSSGTPWAYGSDVNIVIESGVTKIGKLTLAGSTGLKSVTIPNSVIEIGESAFEGCTNLSGSINLKNVTTIGKKAFFGCTNLSGKVKFGNGMTTIGQEAFRNCPNITEIEIPDTVAIISGGAFCECTGIETVKMPITANIAKSTTGYLNGFMNTTSVKNVTLTAGSNGQGCDYTRSGGTPWAYGTDVNIVIESGVTKIGALTFSGATGIKSITMPSSVTEIGNSAFEGCTNLSSSIDFQNVTSIGNKAFNACAYLSGKVKLGNGMTIVNQDAFKDCQSITELEIPDTVTTISGGAFYRCTGIEKVKMPITANIAKSSSGPGNGFMNTTSVTNVILTAGSNGVGCDYTRDGGAPWAYGSNVSIVIESGVTKIGTKTFSGATGIKSVTIPNSVTIIGDNAFGGCSGLTTVDYYGNSSSWASIIIGSNNTYLTGATINYLNN